MVKKKESGAEHCMISTELFRRSEPAVTFQSLSMLFMPFTNLVAKSQKEKEALIKRSCEGQHAL